MNRTPLLLLPLILGGCPYIFEPPAVVPTTGTGVPADVDTDADADADTDADTDTDSGTLPTGSPSTGTPGGTVTNPDPPEIVATTATFEYDKARLVVEIDAQSQLDGGTIWVDDGNAAVVLAIPGDLANWDPSGIATLDFPTGTPCADINLSWTLHVTDAQGRQSTDAVDSLDVTHYAHAEGNDPTDLGSLAAPAIVCGDLGNSNDTDGFEFSGLGGSWTLSLHDLTAGSPVNRDFRIQEVLTGATLGTATSPGDPDSLGFGFLAVTAYRIEVYSPIGGSGSEWQLVIY